MKTPDEHLSALDTGHRANALALELRARVADYERKALDHLVQVHRDRTLTDDQVRAEVAGIAALRDVLATLERDVRQGQESAAHLHTPARPLRTAG